MARSLVWCDSFDFYSNLNDYYTNAGGGASIDLTGTKSRTGIGCLILSQAFGPTIAIPPVRGIVTAYMAGTAFYQDGNGDSTGAGALALYDVDPGGSGDITFLFRVGVNASLGLTALGHTNNVLAITASTLVVPNAYNYIECKVFFDQTHGEAIVRLNGVTLLHLTNIDTLDPSRSSTGGECNNMRFGAPGGASTARHDDTYLYTSTLHDDTDFLGAIRNYTGMPSGNSAPLQWTPLAGSNFSEVNEIPPDGDTSYVSSGTVGQEDQYVYDVSAIPPGLIIYGTLHALDAKQASGSGSVASAVNGIAAAGVGLGGNYHYTIQQPYDINPHTGAPWTLADFPGTVLGPKVTA